MNDRPDPYRNGIAERMSDAERRLDKLDGLYDRVAEIDKAVAVRGEALAALSREMKAGLAANAKATADLGVLIRQNREADVEEERLSVTQKIAVIGGVFVVLASTISAIATLAAH